MDDPTGRPAKDAPSRSSRLNPGQRKLTRIFAFLFVVALSLVLVFTAIG